MQSPDLDRSHLVLFLEPETGRPFGILPAEC